MENKLVVSVGGLHCKACELLSEDSLQRIKNVSRASVNHRTGEAEIFYTGAAPSQEEIKAKLEEIGYKLKPSGNLNKKSDYRWIWLVVAIIIIYSLVANTNMFDFSSLLNGKEFTLSLALLIGLVAGVSTCLALVGGLVLGAASNYSQAHPEASRLQKFKPHLLFNAGRIFGFFLFGGLLGLIGSAFKLSPVLNGVLTVIAALVILFLGLKLIDIFPALRDIDISLPKKFGRGRRSNNVILLGALTFFLPCGFTQAMQIYALGSGDFMRGGLVMALFALGTAPGLLGIGGLASLSKKKNSKTFFKIIGGIVIVFALFNLNNGFKLIQISGATNFLGAPAKNSNDDASSAKENEEDGIQIIRMAETGRGYVPNSFTVKAGVPVRWIIDAQAGYSCASALIVPSLKIEKQLSPGENIIEFTPRETGTIPFSCSMGMYTGKFIVISN